MGAAGWTRDGTKHDFTRFWMPFGFSGLPFGRLGVSFLTFWELFGTSGAPWKAILAPRDQSGGPWEQQDGLDAVDNRIWVDFGMILELVSVCS